eukprot:scaffold29234_cov35-Tisochrysis_lutea.AAC.4
MALIKAKAVRPGTVLPSSGVKPARVEPRNPECSLAGRPPPTQNARDPRNRFLCGSGSSRRQGKGFHCPRGADLSAASLCRLLLSLSPSSLVRLAYSRGRRLAGESTSSHVNLARGRLQGGQSAPLAAETGLPHRSRQGLLLRLLCIGRDEQAASGHRPADGEQGGRAQRRLGHPAHFGPRQQRYSHAAG